MARPREFDTDKALKDAMNVFWQHGYEAASLPDLLTGMGLTRGSLYKAFTDKKTLFLKVLNRYDAEAVEPAVDRLRSGDADGLARITAAFANVVDAVRDGDHRGCLLCSAAAGPAAIDTQIGELVQLQLEKMQTGFEHALADSTAFAQASPQERRAIADMLLSHYVGLRILVRSNAPLDTLQNGVTALARLLQPRP